MLLRLSGFNNFQANSVSISAPPTVLLDNISATHLNPNLVTILCFSRWLVVSTCAVPNNLLMFLLSQVLDMFYFGGTVSSPAMPNQRSCRINSLSLLFISLSKYVPLSKPLCRAGEKVSYATMLTVEMLTVEI